MSGTLSWAAVVLGVVGVAGRAGAASDGGRGQKKRSDRPMLVYVGTYTGGESKGIYVCRMDPGTGRLEATGQTAMAKNPSFLAIHPNKRFLYAVSEIDAAGGKPTGGVSAFSIDPASGGLTLINERASGGKHPCHVSVDATGRAVLVANYSDGTVAMLPIAKDGRLGEASCVVQHEGSSVNPSRQQGPRAHSITPDPGNRFAMAADLGIDKVMIYRLDLSGGKLIANDPPWAKVKPGAGPRHFAFHPSAKFAYLINELDSTMIAFSYNASKGALTEIQTISTLPEGWEGTNYCADVHVHPSGKYVYGSNRGHDSIVVCAIDAGSGKLKVLGYESTRGKMPRNFAIDPSGGFLLAANQDSGNIVTLRIDPGSGLLSATGDELKIPKPVCVKFLE